MLRGACLISLIAISQAASSAIEVRIPVNTAGEVDAAEIVARLAERAGVEVERPSGVLKLPVNGLAGALTRTLLNETLGPEVTIRTAPGEMLVAIEPEALDTARLSRFRDRLADLSARAALESRRRLSYGMHGL